MKKLTMLLIVVIIIFVVLFVYISFFAGNCLDCNPPPFSMEAFNRGCNTWKFGYTCSIDSISNILVRTASKNYTLSELCTIMGYPDPTACAKACGCISCNKEENCCTKDEDCEYIWFTGSCYTPEYVKNSQEEARRLGILIEEAVPRENVTCTCENNRCVTHG